jgi:hypothetical protein
MHGEHGSMSRLPPTRILVAGVAGVAGLVGCAAFDAKQGEWIFSPSDRTWGNPTTATARRDDWIEFDSNVSGAPVRLHLVVTGDDAKASTARPVLLYLHGARWNVEGSSWRIERMHELGFVVVAVDYRGFGKSSPEPPSEDKAYEDARAAWDWVRTRYPGRPRYVFGHSLGGAIAIELARSVDDEHGTIVEGTFTSIPDVVSTMRWGWLPVGWLITQRFDSVAKVADIGSPLLVVHGSQDRLIKPELGRRLYDAAKPPKRFELVEGGSHHNTNGIGQPQYRTALREMFGLGDGDAVASVPGGSR